MRKQDLKKSRKPILSSDFFVLGNIQRIRGLLTLEEEDEELAVHHFSRSLTIFETAEDLYHTALVNFLIGKTLAQTNPERAKNSLATAADIFRKLGVKPLFEEAGKIIEDLKKVKAEK